MHSLDFGLGEVEAWLFFMDFETGRMLCWKGLTMRQLVVSLARTIRLLFELQLSYKIIRLSIIITKYLGSVSGVLDATALATPLRAEHTVRAWSSRYASLHVVTETVL